MKKISLLHKTLIAAYLFIIPINAQQNNFVAKTGDDEISENEFKTRYELMPIVSKNIDQDSLKHELLYTLISEKLQAKEAESLGYDRRTQFTDMYTSLEKMFVRDALFKEEVESKVNISPEEIKKGIEKIKYELKVTAITSPDSAEIIKIHSQLLKGASFDTLLRSRPEYKGQESPFTVSFGNIEMNNIEDTLFALSPGKFSGPVKNKGAWFIFFLHDKQRVNEKVEVSKLESDVRKIIKEKKSRTIGMAYMKSILKDVKLQPDTTAFGIIVNKITDELQKKDTVTNKTPKDFIYLSENDIAAIKNKLGPDTLKMTLVPFENDPSTINDFLNRYYNFEFKTKSTDKKQITAKAGFDLRSFIEGEVLAKEGYKRGFDKRTEVKNDLKMWKDSFLAQMYRNSFIPGSKISDDDVKEYYNKVYNSDQPIMQVKIAELSSPDLSIIELALDSLKAGKDFTKLAGELTNLKTEEPKFVPVTQLGTIGKIASGLKQGEVYGPVKTENGYLLIKMIDKKTDKQTVPQSFVDIKDKLKMDLLKEKLDKVLVDKTVELSVKYPTVINEKALSSLKLTSIKMFTYRLMGFGGKITAVPYSYPFHDWFYKARDIKILP